MYLVTHGHVTGTRPSFGRVTSKTAVNHSFTLLNRDDVFEDDVLSVSDDVVGSAVAVGTSSIGDDMFFGWSFGFSIESKAFSVAFVCVLCVFLQ